MWQTVSREQGETSTTLTFVNGIGQVCPPLIIHKGQRVQEYWYKKALVGVTMAATPSQTKLKLTRRPAGVVLGGGPAAGAGVLFHALVLFFATWTFAGIFGGVFSGVF